MARLLWGPEADLAKDLKAGCVDATMAMSDEQLGAAVLGGQLLNWVCREDESSLDLTCDRLEVRRCGS